MPIRKENRKRYPKDWPKISARIRFERAGGRCECTGQCGLNHSREAERARTWDGIVYNDERCSAEHLEIHPVTASRVVLTVAHLDHIPENCADENLLAMCQQCHNRYDAPMRRRGIQDRQRRSRAAGDLFDEPEE